MDTKNKKQNSRQAKQKSLGDRIIYNFVAFITFGFAMGLTLLIVTILSTALTPIIGIPLTFYIMMYVIGPHLNKADKEAKGH